MRNPNRDIFGEVKKTVSVPSATEYYGMSVRNGMTSCIFHEDRNPSMKLYDDHLNLHRKAADGTSARSDVF